MDRPLLLVTGGELAVVDEADLVARLATGRPFWRSAGLVVRADDGDRAWGQAQWRGLLISARLQFADKHATRKLLREPRVAQVLAPGSPPPDAPAVVVDGGVVVGAWLPRPAVQRGATESLQHAVPPSDAPGARTLRRTPHLDAPDELATAPGTTFTVAVFADTAARADAEAGSDLTLELPPGAGELRVGVLLSVSEHFAVVGEPYATLTLRADAAASAALPFTLSVTGAALLGEAGIVALFTFQGRPCGSVRRAWSWDARLPRATPVVPREGSAPPAVAVHPEAGRPDLTVLVPPRPTTARALCARSAHRCSRPTISRRRPSRSGSLPVPTRSSPRA